MSQSSLTNLNNFIVKYKNSDKLISAFNEFELNWLFNYNSNDLKDVMMNFDFLRDEKYYGTGEYYKDNLQTLLLLWKNYWQSNKLLKLKKNKKP